MPDCYVHSNNLQCPTKDDNDLLYKVDYIRGSSTAVLIVDNDVTLDTEAKHRIMTLVFVLKV